MPEKWQPKTKLGRLVAEGEIRSMEEVFERKELLKEPEIVDRLLPDLANELIPVGGTPGKGGGIRRTPARRSSRTHKSGRRFTYMSAIVVGNFNGWVGVGEGWASETGGFREAIKKATTNAKLEIIPVRRGCGSWRCGCGKPHSLPLATKGKAGSVRVKLKPAPRETGLVCCAEVKKVVSLAGIADLWSKTYGMTKTKLNLAKAAFNALKELNKLRLP